MRIQAMGKYFPHVQRSRLKRWKLAASDSTSGQATHVEPERVRGAGSRACWTRWTEAYVVADRDGHVLTLNDSAKKCLGAVGKTSTQSAEHFAGSAEGRSRRRISQRIAGRRRRD